MSSSWGQYSQCQPTDWWSNPTLIHHTESKFVMTSWSFSWLSSCDNPASPGHPALTQTSRKHQLWYSCYVLIHHLLIWMPVPNSEMLSLWNFLKDPILIPSLSSSVPQIRNYLPSVTSIVWLWLQARETVLMLLGNCGEFSPPSLFPPPLFPLRYHVGVVTSGDCCHTLEKLMKATLGSAVLAESARSWFSVPCSSGGRRQSRSVSGLILALFLLLLRTFCPSWRGSPTAQLPQDSIHPNPLVRTPLLHPVVPPDTSCSKMDPLPSSSTSSTNHSSVFLIWTDFMLVSG